MASIKISDLTSVAALTDNDVLPIVNGGDTKKVSIEQLKEELGGSGGSSDIPIYPFETTNTVSFVLNYPQNFDSTNKSNIQTFLNDLYTQNVGMFAMLLTVGTGSVIDNKSTYYQFLMVPYRSTCKLTDEPTNIYLTGTYRPDASTTSAIMVRFDMNITLTWSNHVCTVTNVEYSGYQYAVVLYNDVLTKTNSTSYTPTANYHPATKKYVDDAVSGTGGGEPSFFIELSSVYFFSGYTYNISASDRGKFSELFKYIAQNNKLPHCIISSPNTSNYYAMDRALFIHAYKYTGDTPGTSSTLDLYGIGANAVGNGKLAGMHQYHITITGNKTTYAITNVTSYCSTGYYLATNNSIAYTPTSDYHPATKKYVDDKTWIGTQAEYDALESYSDTTLYFIKEDTNVSA